MTTKKRFLILFCLIPFFAASQEIDSRFNYELGFGVTQSSLSNTGFFSDNGPIYIPLFGSTNFKLNRNYELNAELEFYVNTFGNAKKEQDGFHHFAKLNLSLFRRVNFLKKNRWVGLGILTGTSKNLYDFVDKRFQNRISETRKWLNTPSSGVQISWKEKGNLFIHKFELSHIFFNYENQRFSFSMKKFPFFFGHKIGFRFPMKKVIELNEVGISQKNIKIDSFYNRWNIALGMDVMTPIKESAQQYNAGFFLESSFRTARNFGFGLSIQRPNGISGGRTGSDERILLSSIWNFGVHVDRYYQIQNDEVFVGIKVARFQNVHTTRFPRRVENIGLILRGGLQLGHFRYHLGYNFTGSEFQNYISYAISYNFGWSKYYR